MPASPASELDALETLPLAECEARHARVRELLAWLQPEAHGLLLSDKLHIYYLTGCLGTGLFWLPREGEPVLLLRKGVERARVESPLSHILPFVSYREIPSLTHDAGSPLGEVLAVDKDNFSWTMAEMLQKRVPNVRFVAADGIMNRARSVKSPFE